MNTQIVNGIKIPKEKGRMVEEAYLPSEGEAKSPGEGACPDPAGHAEESSQRPGLDVHQKVEDGVDEGEKETEVQEQTAAGQEALGLPPDELADRWREVQEDEGGEEDGPDEHGVNEDVDFVAVVRTVEREVPLEVEQAFPRH